LKNIRPWIDYGLAVGSVAAALLLPFWFTALENVAAFLCLAAVAVCAWMGGFGPGLLATAVSAAALAYFYVPPLYSFEIGVLECVELGVFVLVAFLISSAARHAGAAGSVAAPAGRVQASLSGRAGARAAHTALRHFQQP
jgi:K+-sensing histidine kinase KdpD